MTGKPNPPKHRFGAPANPAAGFVPKLHPHHAFPLLHYRLEAARGDGALEKRLVGNNVNAAHGLGLNLVDWGGYVTIDTNDDLEAIETTALHYLRYPHSGAPRTPGEPLRDNETVYIYDTAEQRYVEALHIEHHERELHQNVWFQPAWVITRSWNRNPHANPPDWHEAPGQIVPPRWDTTNPNPTNDRDRDNNNT